MAQTDTPNINFGYDPGDGAHDRRTQVAVNTTIKTADAGPDWTARAGVASTEGKIDGVKQSQSILIMATAGFAAVLLAAVGTSIAYLIKLDAGQGDLAKEIGQLPARLERVITETNRAFIDAVTLAMQAARPQPTSPVIIQMPQLPPSQPLPPTPPTP